MKTQKIFIILIFPLFALTNSIAINESYPFEFSERHHNPFVQLNRTMQSELQLTNKQFDKLLVMNQKYWIYRKKILNTANKVGKNTALLACWDKWRMELATCLTKTQMEQFMQWQSQVDLLSEAPF